ncbi:MAG: SLC13 family permease, partial [Planctomycetes bacterium]|nr:SLC13 family permease [Planctomycetota bacterium]
MTLEIGLVLAVLVVAIALLASEAARVDIVALGILLVLPWLGLITTREAFSGLSSGAVVSMAAVMILGCGVDRSGLTRGLTRPVVEWAGDSDRRLLVALMAVVGTLSAFMQNIGAAALFLPAVTRIARYAGFPASRLLMPMGFAAILGGTVSMIGSGPLILLGDLLHQRGLEPF